MNLDQLKALLNLGWGWLLVGAVLLLLLWEGGKKWVPALAEKLVKGIVAVLAGTRLVRRFSLRTYREQVELTWSRLPVLFADVELDVSTVYVPLQAVDGGDAHRQIRETDHVVVLGPPGAGKSVLLRHSMLTWARGDGVGRVPLLLELHRCNGNTTSLEDLIVEQFDRDGFRKADRFAGRALRTGGLALLFDGLDEVNATERDRVVRLLKDFAVRYSACQIVVTCRSAVYDRQLAPEIAAVFHVQDFDERLIRRFLRQWPGFDAVEQLMSTLRESPRIMQLARNPLLLTMIAYLYEKGGTLPHSRADFYREGIGELLRIKKNTRYPPQAKKALLKHLALVAQDVPAHEVDRRALPYERVLDEIGKKLPSLSIPVAEAPDVLGEIVERTGLLLAVDGGERYQFAHLSLQEFLAAEAVESSADLLERYERAPGDWREVVKLWCGVVSTDCGPLLEQLRGRDALLAFECLADARVVDEAVADGVLQFFMDELGFFQGSVVSGFGALAADPRPRGRRAFDFLVTVAEEGRRTVRGHTARQALAATRLPRAARALFEFRDFTELATMGDLAVPAIAELARSRKDDAPDAVEALGRIGTPAAALVLAKQLWVDDDLARAAAWYLAELISDPEVEAALDEVSVPVGHERLDWVWAPFAGHGTAVYGVVGRIAYLVDTTPEVTEYMEDREVDPRLALPLCALRFGGTTPMPSAVHQMLFGELDPVVGGELEVRLAGGVEVREQDWKDVRLDLGEFQMHMSALHIAIWVVIGAFCGSAVTQGVVLALTDWPWGPTWLGWFWMAFVALLTLLLAWITFESDSGHPLIGLLLGPRAIGLLPAPRAAIPRLVREPDRSTDVVVVCVFVVLACWWPATLGLAFLVGVPVVGWGGMLLLTGGAALAVWALSSYGMRRERRSSNPLRGLLELDELATRTRASVIANVR